MRLIAVIPARGGSKRIPRKNIKPFFGEPIISYPIRVARNSGIFDAVYVSTEDVEIAGVAERYGAGILWRDKELAGDDVTDEQVIDSIDVERDYLCYIYPTAVLVTARQIAEGLITCINTGLNTYCSRIVPSPYGDAIADVGHFYWYKGGKQNITEYAIILDEMECQDINTPDDWQLAEIKYKVRQVEDVVDK